MSRRGSMTMPDRDSRSMTRKLALPSSSARTTSTLNTGESAEERDGREQNPDGDENHDDRAAVEDHLCRDALRGRHTKVGEQVAQAVREVEESERDEHQQVELHQRVADHVG